MVKPRELGRILSAKVRFMGTIIVADDHPLFRAAVKVSLEPFGVSVAECATLDDCHATLECRDDVDLVFLDLRMPGSQGLFGLVSLRNRFPSIPVAIISGNDSSATIQKAMTLGARGFIPKSTTPTKMQEAMRCILGGTGWFPDGIQPDSDLWAPEDHEIAQRVARLTPQQYTVLGYLRAGKLNKEIAYELGICEATVKAHVSAIFKKLEVSNRTQVVVMASKLFTD